jgi:uncharacterized protein involved in exopolysaccharide biosynthesis
LSLIQEVVLTDTEIRQQQPPYTDEDEINLLDYWRVIWKRRKLIGYIVMATVLLTAVTSLFMTNLYQAKAVIMPVSAKGGGGGGSGLAALASQFGNLPGIAIPASASASEIINLMKSNILREKMIQQYNLMPILFYKKWDVERQAWKKDGFSLNPLYYLSLLTRAVAPALSLTMQKKDPDTPEMWDALRALDDIIKVTNSIKENTITITVDYRDPELAAKFAEYAMKTLTDFMSSEAKRVATTNRIYLEQQLVTMADPLIKQKTYNLIAEQIEMAMMAEVKENFAFKVIDPPKAPDKKIKPKRAQMVMLSFVVAFFIGIFVVFFLEYVEKVRKKEEEHPSTLMERDVG